MNISFKLNPNLFIEIKKYQKDNFITDEKMMELLWLKLSTYYRFLKTKKLSSAKIQLLMEHIEKNKLPFKVYWVSEDEVSEESKPEETPGESSENK